MRIHRDIARIETDQKDLHLLVEKRGMITEYLKHLGYLYITLDLEGFRSGSMDVL